MTAKDQNPATRTHETPTNDTTHEAQPRARTMNTTTATNHTATDTPASEEPHAVAGR